MSLLANYSLLGRKKSGSDSPFSFNISAAALGYMLQESANNQVPTTAVSADSDLVGLIYDQSINAAICSAGPRLVIGSGSGRKSWLRWTASNSSQLRVLSSTSYFNKFWSLDPRGGFGIHIKMMSADTSVQRIFDTSGASNSNNGVQILRNSSGNLIVRGSTAASGIIWTATSTSTFTVADGWRSFVIHLGGVGTGTGRLRIYNSTGTLIENQTFNISAGAQANANQLACFGTSLATLTQYADMQVSLIRMWSDTPSIDQADAFSLIDEDRYSTFEPILQWKFDYSDPRFIYSDEAGQIQANDGDPVRVLRSQTIGNWNIPNNAPYQNLRRQFESDSDSTSAVWRENGQQSHMEYDGTNDNYKPIPLMMEEVGGRWTYVRVAKNNDASFGSHLFSTTAPDVSNRGLYHTLTGSAYGVLDPNPRTVVHGNPNVNPLSSPCENTGVDDIKIIVWVRDGLNLKCYNGDGTMVEEDDFSPALTFNQMGAAYSAHTPNWHFDGRDYYMEKWNGVHDETWILNKISELRTRFPSGL